MPRLSTKEVMYCRSLSEIVCSLAGASATSGPRVSRNAEYKHSQRARYKVEALFAELKQQIKLRRVRLRRLWNVAEQFHLAATAQNLKRLVGRLAQRQMPELSTT